VKWPEIMDVGSKRRALRSPSLFTIFSVVFLVDGQRRKLVEWEKGVDFKRKLFLNILLFVICGDAPQIQRDFVSKWNEVFGRWGLGIWSVWLCLRSVCWVAFCVYFDLLCKQNEAD